jgi:hypothetical protein
MLAHAARIRPISAENCWVKILRWLVRALPADGPTLIILSAERLYTITACRGAEV